MAWTEITGRHYQRDHLRYASDTTEEEWGASRCICHRRPIVGVPGKPTYAKLSTPSFISRRPAANGA
jgi:hypothetical protein